MPASDKLTSLIQAAVAALPSDESLSASSLLIDVEQQKLVDRLKTALELGATIQFNRALDISAKIVHSPDAEVIQNIYDRNRRLYCAPEIAQKMLQAVDADSEPLRKLRRKIGTEGALIEPHQLLDFENRLRDSGRWVMSVASARHPDPNSEFHNTIHIAADCQCFLPEDSDSADRVVEVPEKNIDIYNEGLLARIKSAHPATIGYIDQISVDPEFAHLRVASEARYEALRHINRDTSRKYPIDHMIGLSFCLQGLEILEIDDCSKTPPLEYLLETFDVKSIANMISLLVNEQSERCPATIVARIKGRKVPVNFVYDNKSIKGNILLDWYYLDHQMSQMNFITPDV